MKTEASRNNIGHGAAKAGTSKSVTAAQAHQKLMLGNILCKNTWNQLCQAKAACAAKQSVAITASIVLPFLFHAQNKRGKKRSNKGHYMTGDRARRTRKRSLLAPGLYQ